MKPNPTTKRRRARKKEVYRFKIISKPGVEWKKPLQKIVVISLLGALTFIWTYAAALHLRMKHLTAEDLAERGLRAMTEEFHNYKAFVDTEIKSIKAENWGMEPTISENDIVLWTWVRSSEIREGDIIVYHEPPDNELVAHRVIWVDNTDPENPVFQTKGDGLAENDPYFVDDELGMVIGVLYYRGRWWMY
jgi:hypothetical protein